MIEAGRQFRRVNDHLHLPRLRAALDSQSAESVGPEVHDDQVNAA
jgi:putative transposase